MTLTDQLGTRNPLWDVVFGQLTSPAPAHGSAALVLPKAPAVHVARARPLVMTVDLEAHAAVVQHAAGAAELAALLAVDVGRVVIVRTAEDLVAIGEFDLALAVCAGDAESENAVIELALALGMV